MSTDHILLFGAGGHAAVVLDALSLGTQQRDIVVVDSNPALKGQQLLGVSIMTPDNDTISACRHFHVAVGDNRTRAQIFADLCQDGRRAITITHPAAAISPFAFMSDGCFVAAQSVVAPRTRLGKSTIINHGAVVDHDCLVGDFCHIAPTASLGGNIMVGDFVLIGAGANILPGIKIGDGASIGAGAVVTRNVEPGAVVTGVPAVTVERS